MALSPQDLEAMRVATDGSLSAAERNARLASIYADPGMPAPPPMVDMGATAQLAAPPATADYAPVPPETLSDAPAHVATPEVIPVSAHGLGPAASGAPAGIAQWAQGQHAQEQGQIAEDTAQQIAQAQGLVPQAPNAHAAAAPDTIDSSKFHVTPTGAPAPGKANLADVQFAGDASGAPQPPAFDASAWRPSGGGYAKVGSNSFEPVSQIRKGAVDLPPGTADQYGQALDAQADAATKGAEAAQRDDARIAEATRRAQEAKQRIDQGYGDAAAARMADMKRRQAMYDTTLASFQKSADVDPDRWWGKQSTGGKIVMAIAAALGQFSAAINHTPNAALGIIQKHIDDDISAQRDNIEKRKAGVDTMRGSLDVARQLSSDKDAQDNIARQMAYSQVDSYLKQFADSARTPEQKAKLEAMRAELQQKKIDAAASFAEKTQGQVTTAFKFNPERVVGGGGKPPVERAAAMLKKMGYSPKDPQWNGMMDNLLGGPGWRAGVGGAGAGSGLSDFERELGLTAPAGTRTAEGQLVRDAGKKEADGLSLVQLNEQWRKQARDANANYTDRARANKAERTADELRGLYQTQVLGAHSEETSKKADEHIPLAGFGHVTLNSSIDNSADATNERVLSQINAARVAAGGKPMTMEQMLAKARGYKRPASAQPVE